MSEDQKATPSHPVVSLSTDTWVKVILFVIAHSGIILAFAWQYTNVTEKRLVALETITAQLVKVVDRLELDRDALIQKQRNNGKP